MLPQSYAIYYFTGLRLTDAGNKSSKSAYMICVCLRASTPQYQYRASRQKIWKPPSTIVIIIKHTGAKMDASATAR